jgi:hypothetical protein
MKKLLTLALTMVAASAMAFQARMDISGVKNAVNLTPGSKSAGCAVSNPGWVKPETKKNQQIYFASPRLKDDWQEVEFSFTPDKDGQLNLAIRGQWRNTKKGDEPFYVFYKKVEIVEGAVLRNGDFSQKNEDGSPQAWRYNKKANELPVFGEDAGASTIKVQFNNALTQTIAVKAGQPVKVRAIIKSAMP